MPNTVNFFAPNIADQIELQQRLSRAQQLAQAMTGESMTPIDAGPRGKASWTQALAKMVQGYVGGKQQQNATDLAKQLAQAQQQGMMSMFLGPSAAQIQPAQTTPQTTSPQSFAGAASPAQMSQSGLQQPGAPGQQPYSGGFVPSLTGSRTGDIGMLAGMGPEGYTKAVADRLYPTPTDTSKMLREAGIDPSSPTGREQLVAMLNKSSYIAPVNMRAGSTALDPKTLQPLYNAPQDGIQIQYDANGRPFATQVPGFRDLNAGNIAAQTQAKALNTPVQAQDAMGRPTFIYPQASGRVPTQGAPAPAGAAQPPSMPQMPGASNAAQAAAGNAYGGGLQTTAGKASQEALGRGSADFVEDMRKQADAALSLRKGLKESINLSQDAPPNALAPMKTKVGAYMIALGADPAQVKGWLGLDPGAAEAMNKLTASMAVSGIKELTNRGTQFEFGKFMDMNPNAGLTPEGLRRVSQYMLQSSQTSIDQFQEFAKWRAGKSPDTWAIDFPAYWQAKVAHDIDAGKYLSTPAQYSMPSGGSNLPPVVPNANPASMVGPKPWEKKW